MSEWRPIETAPRDGTAILAAKPNRIGVVLYPIRARDQDGRWQAYFGDGDWRSYDPQPTHWMPLPAPPETTEG